jgi:hypothetical protein
VKTDMGCEMWGDPKSDQIRIDRLLTPPRSHLPHPSFRAGNGTRTRDPNLGKVVLYQLSYSRDASKQLISHTVPATSAFCRVTNRSAYPMEARGIEPLTS